MTKDIEQSITRLERRNRKLTWGVSGLLIIWMATLATLFAFKMDIFGKSLSPSTDEILRVRGLVIVDKNNTERVWIGAPVPDPLILGKRFPRGSSVSGILLFDAEGNERSGYVTSDGYPNVLFTLDSLAKQHVLFMAEPQGDPSLVLWDHSNRFNLTVGEEAPQMKMTRGNQTIFEVPPAKQEEK
jgi:hypothetical protein